MNLSGTDSLQGVMLTCLMLQSVTTLPT